MTKNPLIIYRKIITSDINPYGGGCLIFNIFHPKNCGACFFGKYTDYLHCLISSNKDCHIPFYRWEDKPNALAYLLKRFPTLLLEEEKE